MWESSPDGAQMFLTNEAMRADVIEDKWIIDSAASRHTTFQRNLLFHFKKLDTPEIVGLGDGHRRSYCIRADTSNGNLISFGRNCWIRDGKRQLIGTDLPMGKLYNFNGYAMKSVVATANFADERSE
uniref:Uncharacterized protein n=1 Tax=Amphimedon queenslandica TaxID=400682 RepID=A0A1X7VCC3_AMPQE